MPLLSLDKVLVSQQCQGLEKNKHQHRLGHAWGEWEICQQQGLDLVPYLRGGGKKRKKACSLFRTEYPQLVWEHRQGGAC